MVTSGTVLEFRSLGHLTEARTTHTDTQTQNVGIRARAVEGKLLEQSTRERKTLASLCPVLLQASSRASS